MITFKLPTNRARAALARVWKVDIANVIPLSNSKTD